MHVSENGDGFTSTDLQQRMLDEAVKSSSMAFYATKNKKYDFHFPYKSITCNASYGF